jgi:hypothetical protein
MTLLTGRSANHPGYSAVVEVQAACLTCVIVQETSFRRSLRSNRSYEYIHVSVPAQLEGERWV